MKSFRRKSLTLVSLLCVLAIPSCGQSTPKSIRSEEKTGVVSDRVGGGAALVAGPQIIVCELYATMYDPIAPVGGSSAVIKFAPGNCTGGALPDDSYVGVPNRMFVAGGFNSFAISSGKDTGVSIVCGPGTTVRNRQGCFSFNFKVVYIKG